ncbi:MAG: hypothetical protein WCC08_03335 [Terrimicrobiaceae bacterium]
MTDAEPDRPQGRDVNEGGQQEKITGTRKQLIEASDHLHVAASRNQKSGSPSLTVGGDQQEKVGSKHALEAGQEIGCQPVAVLKIPNGFAAAYDVACCVRCGSQDRASGRVSACPRLHDFALSAFVLEFGAGN